MMALVLGEEKMPKPNPRTARQPTTSRNLVEEDEQDEAQKRDRHAQRGDRSRLAPIRELAGERRDQSLHHRLCDQHETGILRRQSTDPLQVEAEQKTDGKGGGVVDQCRQVRHGKDGVVAE
jgi:hypothetical protein